MNLFLIFVVILLLMLIMCSFKKKHNIDEKTIWTYWEQGRKNIPPFSKLCVKTWKQKNPNHRVIIVDKYNVYEYLDKKDLPPNWEKIEKVQHKSDFVRIALLAKYGGIWMDLCIICIKPINSVFTQTKSLEGFCYRHNSKTRDLSMYENWFITGKKDSEIIKLWHKEFLKVFGDCSSSSDIDESYFDGVDYQNLLHYHPASYLTMNRVLLKCIQNNNRIKYLFDHDSTLLGAEETGFIHYIYFGWDIGNIENIFEENEDFIKVLDKSNTPVLKFTGEWNKYLNEMNMNVFKNNKDSVIYKLLNF